MGSNIQAFRDSIESAIGFVPQGVEEEWQAFEANPDVNNAANLANHLKAYLGEEGVVKDPDALVSALWEEWSLLAKWEKTVASEFASIGVGRFASTIGNFETGLEPLGARMTPGPEFVPPVTTPPSSVLSNIGKILAALNPYGRAAVGGFILGELSTEIVPLTGPEIAFRDWLFGEPEVALSSPPMHDPWEPGEPDGRKNGEMTEDAKEILRECLQELGLTPEGPGDISMTRLLRHLSYFVRKDLRREMLCIAPTVAQTSGEACQALLDESRGFDDFLASIYNVMSKFGLESLSQKMINYLTEERKKLLEFLIENFCKPI